MKSYSTFNLILILTFLQAEERSFVSSKKLLLKSIFFI